MVNYVITSVIRYRKRYGKHHPLTVRKQAFENRKVMFEFRPTKKSMIIADRASKIWTDWNSKKKGSKTAQQKERNRKKNTEVRKAYKFTSP